eukprot:gnl/TRDRNA2_/TRDRNA2_156494_c0_seq1.p1 gnl/TRDRNA2_/TRDRNA2_156494_c0~~gnl/TRDRNA2_/TRDRNA2_156494_c0_seq1.p1  ORF type:complete len:382 (-),score=70.97 gnl/TRDRNA2_/TRDRNA2_156494_c0_seq1:48-1124(-)
MAAAASVGSLPSCSRTLDLREPLCCNAVPPVDSGADQERCRIKALKKVVLLSVFVVSAVALAQSKVPLVRGRFGVQLQEETTKKSPYKIGFIGGGMMAEALLGGILKNGIADIEDVIVYDAYQPRLDFLTGRYNIKTAESNIQVCQSADIIIFAVKPGVFEEAAASLRGLGGGKRLFVSIMAGVTLDSLQDKLGSHGDVVRVMPNTPALVSCGASCYVKGKQKDATNADRVAFMEKIFKAIGICHEVQKEANLDAVTGLSGSGPAYVYMMIEAMADGGVLNGLQREIAIKLAAQTVMGAAKMVAETGQHPAVLKNNVESPAGTTIAGTAMLETGNFRNTVIKAVTAATEKSAALGLKK